MFNVDIRRLVPKFLLWDKNGYAIAKALEAGLQILCDTAEQGVKLITDIDTMPEWRLDELAWETNFLYDYSADIESKRRLLKNLLKIYRRMGTRYAVENALQALFPGSKLNEWFEYEGKPYHFQLECKLDQHTGVTEEQQAFAIRNILFYKNVRSVLDGMTYITELDPTGFYLGVVMGQGYISTKLNEIQPEYKLETTVYDMPTLEMTHASTALQPIAIGFDSLEHLAVGVAGITSTRKMIDLDKEG